MGATPEKRSLKILLFEDNSWEVKKIFNETSFPRKDKKRCLGYFFKTLTSTVDNSVNWQVFFKFLGNLFKKCKFRRGLCLLKVCNCSKHIKSFLNFPLGRTKENLDLLWTIILHKEYRMWISFSSQKAVTLASNWETDRVTNLRRKNGNKNFFEEVKLDRDFKGRVH